MNYPIQHLKDRLRLVHWHYQITLMAIMKGRHKIYPELGAAHLTNREEILQIKRAIRKLETSK